jgi:drug/metabolite transporter (DMT)-like permease
MKNPGKNVMGLFEWLLLIMLAAIWGGSFFFGKVAVASLPAFTIVLGRVGIAALVLNVIVAAIGRKIPRPLKTRGLFMVMGVLNNMIPFSLIFWRDQNCQWSGVHSQCHSSFVDGIACPFPDAG